MPNIGEIKTGCEIFGSRNRHKFIWIACEECGKERWVLLVKGRPTSKWCNACAIRKPRRGASIRCSVCGKEFYRQPSEIRERNYCSVGCHNRGQIKGERLVCLTCGKGYYRSPSQVKYRGSSYCSKKCQGKAQSILQKGENSNFWKGGVSSENRRLRASQQWKTWRDAIFARDNWTCQECGKRSNKGHPVTLHPHHIKSFAEYPELRFVISNGLTLCVECHKKHNGKD